MIDEHAALKGAQAAVPEETVTQVAVVFPTGTTMAQLGGSLAGGVLGGSGGVAVGGAATNIALDATEEAASVVLALTAEALHMLGRRRVAPFGSFKHLTALHAVPRKDLKVEQGREAVLHTLTIHNTATGESWSYEVKPLGSGVDDLVAALSRGTS